MTDIAERLMKLARSFSVVAEDGFTISYADGAILVEAADKIVSLRAERDAARADAQCAKAELKETA